MATDYDLALIQGERFTCGFRYLPAGEAQDLMDWTWRAQARQKESVTSALIADLTERLVLDEEDPTLLVLDLPAELTTTIGLTRVADTASWDIFLWPTADPSSAIRLLQGAVTMDKAATDTRNA